MKLNSSFLKDIYLVALTLVLFVLIFNLATPFITTLLLAVILVALFQSPYNYLVKDLKFSKGLASAVCTLGVLLVVVIPLLIIVLMVTGEIASYAPQMITFFNETIRPGLEGLISNGRISGFLKSYNINVDLTGLTNSIIGLITNAAGASSNVLVGVLSNIGGLFVQFIVLVIALGLLFKDYHKIPEVITRYVPLSDELELLLYEEFIDTGKSVIKGSFTVAFVHGLALTLLFAIFGVEPLGLVFVITFLSSLLPGGSQIVWVPAVILMILTGNIPGAILLAICSIVVMNGIDTFVRPRITQGSNKIHPLLSLISVIGGIFIYGIGGLLYGPLIAVGFITVVGAYNQRFSPLRKEISGEVVKENTKN